jgi:four helix bundle protein
VFSNIVQGHGRRTQGDRMPFYEIAWVSLVELEARAEHATRCELLLPTYAADFGDRSRWTGRLLAALRRTAR